MWNFLYIKDMWNVFVYDTDFKIVESSSSDEFKFIFSFRST